MLKLENLKKSFGGVAATRDVTLDFANGSLSAIIGPNGAGKTTLFNLITGRFPPDSGRILLAGENIAGLSQRRIVRLGIGRAFQVASLFPTLTVAEAWRRRRRPISTARPSCGRHSRSPPPRGRVRRLWSCWALRGLRGSSVAT